MSVSNFPLSIVVVGASGDLARKKIYPALFSLFCQGFLPDGFNITGFARSGFNEADFKARISENLSCRYVPDGDGACARRMDSFLAHCHYVQGSYESRDSFLDLYERLRTVEAGGSVNRLFFLAVPSDLYLSIAHSIAGAGLVYCGLNDPWSRVVIEKPFGRDRESSDLLASELGKVFVEDQTFRIDHYLGKEVIQNLMVLRFANAVFEPLWNRDCIERVRITWKEDFGCDGRGGYFDRYGIIRDVMQNHLLQMLALIAMERPESVKSTHVRNAKVSLLRQVYPVSIDDLLTGQYVGSRQGDMVRKGYAEDATVPADSMTPTFASAVLRINNDRWQGVPFLITAGKALDARMTEIRIIFKKMPGNLFCKPGKCPEQNELLIHVQPDESIHLKIVSKVPGLDLSIEPRQLDLRYESAFAQKIPEAYECLLLDVLEGDRGLFIRSDELEASWDVFTPVLRESESRRIKPEPYEYGSKGPAGADKMAERNGYGD